MIDHEKYLKTEYTSGDGVYFSIEGYKMMDYSLFENVLKKQSKFD